MLGPAGEPGEQFAQLQAGNSRVDGAEFAADFDRRLGLEVDHVLVRRATRQKDLDDRLVGLASARLRLGTQQTGKRQLGQSDPAQPQASQTPAAKAQAADLQKGTTREPVTGPRTAPPQRWKVLECHRCLPTRLSLCLRCRESITPANPRPMAAWANAGARPRLPA